MNREIPGFYYDPHKKKYFRIERDQTAPAQATWSASNVKRKRDEAQKAEDAQRRQKLTTGMIKRSALWNGLLTGSLLNRAIGPKTPDMYAAVWARELTNKKQVPAFPFSGRQQSPNVQHMYIDGSDTKTGLGVAYYTTDERSLLSHYIPANTDKHDIINLYDQSYIQHQPFHTLREMVSIPSMSSITYRQSTNHMILASRAPSAENGGICIFSPRLSRPEDNRPAWLLGENDIFQKLSLPDGYERDIINTCLAAPAASRFMCLIATKKQLFGFEDDRGFRTIGIDGDGRRLGNDYPIAVNDILSIDFQPTNHHVLFAGARDRTFSLIDLRSPRYEWDVRRGKSAIGKIRALNEVQVLAAGARDTMAIYDMRFKKKHKEWPLVKFPEYKNSAHLDLGLDVQPKAGHGIVAVAHDDGKVAVYSLYSGKRLKAGDVDKIAADRPIKSMMFQTMPREKEPSLFVGLGPYIEKYSFGSNEDEW